MHNRFFRFALPAVVLFAAFVLPAQARVQNRINTPITDSDRATMQHTVPGRALRANDLGSAPSDRKLESVTLYFNMTAAQQADLTQLLIDQQNTNSPSYHQWLTPAQFGARFGLSSSDLAKVTGWLTNKGLTIVDTAPSSNSVSVSGTVAQFESAFAVKIHAMSENGVAHIANINDPQFPTPIANIVTGVTGLHDFKLKPRARVSTPKYTSSVAPGNHYIAPGDFYTIYDVNQLISTNSINGTGISIAVVGQTDISTTDVAAFRSASGLSSNLPTIVKATGYVAGTVSGDIDEAQLDVEWSGAVAPNATIFYVTVGASSTASVIDALNYAISNNVAPIVSISYGGCESGWGQSELNSINQKLQQANAEGITVIGPAGDSGATDCDTDPPADFGLTVDFPASSPFATAAGGAMFNEGSATGTTAYWNSNNSSSTANAGSAISYIPETVWNESNSSSLGAGGGGVSAYFSKPAWQVGTGVPSDSSRDVPDVSFNAAAIHDGYLFCSQGSCTSGFRNAATGNLNVVGGTSVATPTLAGVFALLEQQLGGGTANRIGNANPMIYGLANSTYYNNVFHDITAGNNNSPCQQGTPNCPNGGTIGYNAAPGYDLATGWGSLDVYNFVTKWKLATPTGTGSTTGTAISSTTVTTTGALCSNASGSVALTIAVANGSGTSLAVPTGTVQALVDNVAVTGSNTATLSGGNATFTLTTSALSSGGHTVSVVYLGDGNYAASKGSLYVDIVSGSQKDFALTPCTAPSSASVGGSATGITFTLTPANGFTGAVTLTASVDSTVSASYNFSPSTVTVSSSSPVTASFVLNAYQSSSGSSTPLIAQNSRPTFYKAPWYIAGSGASLACMMLLVLPRRRRWGALLALLLSVAAISTSGCGSSSSSSSGSSGGSTPTTTFAARGTYTVNVTATSGSLVHTSTVTFTVQ